MNVASVVLPAAATVAVIALVACQAAPAPETQVAATTVPPSPTAAPTPDAAPLSLGPITAQTVLVDQVGYLPTLPKTAVVTGSDAASADTFQLVDTRTDRAVFAGRVGALTKDSDTGQPLRSADFSSFTESGSYTVVVPGVGRSPEFRIGTDVYAQLGRDALDSYEQLAVLAPKGWQTASVKDRTSNQTVNVTGGWPDAGDYGRYMPSAASALGTLLLVDDLFPQQAQADALSVLKRELDWVLTMQRSDGSVYHKVTPLQFGGFDKNSDNIGGQLYAFDPNTADAAVFAAITAEAARVYSASDATYSAQLLAAAQKSWSYLSQQPKAILPPELEGTGGYVYGGDSSQRFWAAAELYKTTGDPSYGQYVSDYVARRSPSIGLLGWTNTDTYGLLSLAFNDAADPALRARITGNLVQWADGTVTSVTSPINPWSDSVSEFHWASNKTGLDNAVLLLIANRAAPNVRYVAAANEQLHFVLGRNALAKSFVTRYGTNTVQNPHNRTMFVIGRLVPGVLVGGPNGDGQDGITPTAQGQRSYVDQLQAYASNENSVEYNAPLVFVTSVLAATAS
ncbi:MAG: glycoside hydrolase family 9 protein [Chloroflexi bacterium]|nr:glycoside hydrolase family 9 protein [Chloroflexota bacterium]MBV9131501.1 glycoside hydrolase family 9 protein [Chloroflexota bacterium]MBV9895499.1 glycoside hydrolase family 9 protein [Chloroflexota bacterium]